MKKYRFNISRSWACRKYFKREMQQSRKTMSKEDETQNEVLTTAQNAPLLAKAILITLIAIPIIGLLCATIVPLIIQANVLKHECIFSDYGSSTSTCKTLGETTYWCIYHETEYYHCQNKKVVKDTEYKQCSYITESILSEKLTQNVYFLRCKWCGKGKTETVNNYYGSCGQAKILNDLTATRIEDGVFAFCAATSDEFKPAKGEYYYAILYLFDDNENCYWKQSIKFKFLQNGLYGHSITVEKSLLGKLNTYRWDISKTDIDN